MQHTDNQMAYKNKHILAVKKENIGEK